MRTASAQLHAADADRAGVGCRRGMQLTGFFACDVPAGLLNAGFLLHEYGKRFLKAWPHSKVISHCIAGQAA